MASKQRITKIDAGAQEVTRKTATVGGTVIADYLNPLDGHRILVIERMNVPKPTPKKRTPKVPHQALVPEKVGL